MSNVCEELLSDSSDDEIEDEEVSDDAEQGSVKKELKEEFTDDQEGVDCEEESGNDVEESEEDEEESDEDEEQELKEGDELDGIMASSSKGAPVPIQIDSSINKSWQDLGLSRWLLDQLKNLQLKKPTPVQIACIPKVMEGCDVLGCAKTGTGKTLAFALPILNELAIDPYGIFALVLTPTRELAIQIHEQFVAVGKPIGLKSVAIIGGTHQNTQAADVCKKPHVVVATPGRLADFIETHSDSIGTLFKKVKYFVLDEADRMLDGQYAQQLKSIFAVLPKKRQTLLFSATITSAINQLHQVSVRKPYFFEDKTETMTVDRLEQKYVLCPLNVKDAYLVYVVKNYSERNLKSSVIIFSHTCRECQALAIMFNKLGFEVGSLHSQISQKDRSSALARFRQKTLKVLICTDVAARGLDISHIDLVVNHNVPDCPKTYVHRVGRSARAGRFGAALTFVSQYDIGLLKAIEKMTGKQMEEQKVNDKMVSQYVTQVLVTKREAELTLDQEDFGRKKEVQKRKDLIMGGMTPEEADNLLEEQKKQRLSRGKRRVDKLDEHIAKRKKKDEIKNENGKSNKLSKGMKKKEFVAV